MVLGKNLLIFLYIFETIFVIDTSKALGSKCAFGKLAYFIYYRQHLVYTVVIYHIGTFDKCISSIYNIINYCCYAKCQYVAICVCNCNRFAR